MDAILSFLRYAPALVLAIVIHESAHALAALAVGDRSAKDMGRVSLNPFNHLDPIGLISLFIFKFGWAKPVPINPRNFKNYNLGMFVVSIAGIVTNFIFAYICSLLIKANIVSGSSYLNTFLFMSMLINLNLAFFNLIPLPPLDGSNILLSFFSPRTAYEVQKYSRYTQLLLVVLIFSGSISNVLGQLVMSTMNWMLSWVKIYL